MYETHEPQYAIAGLEHHEINTGKIWTRLVPTLQSVQNF
jgi:hypothetical protein